MHHISGYDARLAEERRVNNSNFRLFQVCHFKIVLTHITTADWNRLNKLLYCTFRRKHLFLGNDITV